MSCGANGLYTFHANIHFMQMHEVPKPVGAICREVRERERGREGVWGWTGGWGWGPEGGRAWRGGGRGGRCRRRDKGVHACNHTGAGYLSAALRTRHAQLTT